MDISDLYTSGHFNTSGQESAASATARKAPSGPAQDDDHFGAFGVAQEYKIVQSNPSGSKSQDFIGQASLLGPLLPVAFSQSALRKAVAGSKVSNHGYRHCRLPAPSMPSMKSACPAQNIRVRRSLDVY